MAYSGDPCSSTNLMGRGQKYTFDEGGVAFYYFMATAVALYVVPKTIKMLISVVYPAVVAAGPSQFYGCSCEQCADKEQRKASISSKRSKRSVLVSGGWLVLGWIVLVGFVTLAVRNAKEEAKVFDPYEILSIPSSSADTTIRKAFKKLSLRYHPDKAKPENRKAHEKRFLEITRAYRALTDETARKNWEEYGNPDGPKTSSLGIALPSWLVDSKFNYITVFVYFLLFGVGIPLLVRSIWQRSKEYTRDHILHSSMQLFYKEMKEVASIKRIVEVLAIADEFKELAMPRDRVQSVIDRICEASPEPYEPGKRIAGSLAAATAHSLLTAHMLRVQLSTEDRLVADKVIMKAIRLLNGIYQISIAKKWTACTMNCMTLSVFLIQGVTENASPLMQLPYLKPDILKHCKTKRRQVSSIKDVIDLDDDERASLFRDLTSEQVANLVNVAKQMPLLLVRSAEFKMLGQDQVTPAGMVTCIVNLELTTHGKLRAASDSAAAPENNSALAAAATNNNSSHHDHEGPIAFEFDEEGNLLEGGKVRFATQDEVIARLAPVHAPYFPADKRPGWWVVLLTRNMSHIIAPPVRVVDLFDRKTVSFQFAAPSRPGKYPFRLAVRSDCLLGVDVQRDVDLTVVPASSGHGASSEAGSDGDNGNTHSNSKSDSEESASDSGF